MKSLPHSLMGQEMNLCKVIVSLSVSVGLSDFVRGHLTCMDSVLIDPRNYFPHIHMKQANKQNPPATFITAQHFFLDATFIFSFTCFAPFLFKLH